MRQMLPTQTVKALVSSDATQSVHAAATGSGTPLAHTGVPIFEIRGLDVALPASVSVSANFTNRAQSCVLRNVNFSVARGRTLGLIGESGAGKSMIGRVISRHLPAGFEVVAGEMRFDGEDLLHASARTHRRLLGDRIAFIPQEPMAALNPVLTIGALFNDHFARLGVPRRERRERTVNALAEVLLPDPVALLKRYSWELSGGMCQRVMIALAFSSDPDLVVSDEATTALDPGTQAHVVRLIRQLQARRGAGVIFITHDLGLASHVCDEIAVLYAGETIEGGAAKEVLMAPRHPYTKALLRAVPSLDGPLHMLVPLNGHMPGLGDFKHIAGCRFAARCSERMDSCVVAPIANVDLGHGRLVRCLRAAEDVANDAHAEPAVLAGATAVPTALLEPLEPLASLSRPVKRDNPHAQQREGLPPLLTVANLSKSYIARGSWRKAGTSTVAVKPLDLTIAAGEFVGVIGGSGSGKSTLARTIMGLEMPSSGTIHLDGAQLGEDPADWKRRIDAIQMIFQDPRAALNPKRRVEQILTQGWEQRPHLKVDRQTRATDLIGDVGLPVDMLTRFPFQMSGGQRQRINIGRALCDVPRLLIADEIVSGLDVSVQAQILNLLLDLRRQYGIALLLVSHDLGVVRYLCDRVIVMREGEIVESGPAQKVLSEPEHAYTRSLIAAVPPLSGRGSWPD